MRRRQRALDDAAHLGAAGAVRPGQRTGSMTGLMASAGGGGGHWTASWWWDGRGWTGRRRSHSQMPCTRMRAETDRGSSGWVSASRRTVRCGDGQRVAGHAGDERGPARPPQDDLHPHLLVGLGDGEAVGAGHVVEGADVERLVDLGAAELVSVHEVGVPVAIGVVHLDDGAHELAVWVVAPVDADAG